MNILEVGMIGIVGTLLIVQFQTEKREFGIYICVAISIFIFANILNEFNGLIIALKEFKKLSSLNTTYFPTILKILGISYVAEFSAAICKDGGQNVLSMQIEIFGKLSILLLSIPILLALVKTIATFLS